MKKIMQLVVLAIIITLSLQVVLGHGLEDKTQEKVAGEYIVEFAVKPPYPVASRETHLDFIINGEKGKPIGGLQVSAEIHTHDLDSEVTIKAVEEELGHYVVTHVFRQAGEYEAHIKIDDEEAGDFELVVEGFGKSGWIRALVMVGTLLFLSLSAWNDCRKVKKDV